MGGGAGAGWLGGTGVWGGDRIMVSESRGHQIKKAEALADSKRRRTKIKKATSDHVPVKRKGRQQQKKIKKEEKRRRNK